MGNNNSKKSIYKTPIIITMLVLGLWGLSWFLIDTYVDQRGTFGDMFGSVNSLFSGIGISLQISSKFYG